MKKLSDPYIFKIKKAGFSVRANNVKSCYTIKLALDADSVYSLVVPYDTDATVPGTNLAMEIATALQLLYTRPHPYSEEDCEYIKEKLLLLDESFYSLGSGSIPAWANSRSSEFFLEDSPAHEPYFTVYTDGGCNGNPGQGAYGVLIVDEETGERSTYSGSFQMTTNNRMEITAVLVALKHLPENSNIALYSDSQYVIKCLTGEFQRKKNVDLWHRMDQLMADKKLYPNWVQGHNGNPNNELCDKLCREAMRHPAKYKDRGFESMSS